MEASRIESLDIAGDHYEDLIGTLAKNPNAPSILGLKFLRRHIVTIDFANRTLFLKPSSLFTELEIADMSGLHIVRQNLDTVIYAVDPGSPAAQAKLAAGDVIESINGKAAATLTLREVRRALKSQDNDPVLVGIRRGNQDEGVFRFVLRKML